MLKSLIHYSPYIELDEPFAKHRSLAIVRGAHQWLITLASTQAIVLLGLLSDNGTYPHSGVPLHRISDSAAYDSRDKWLAEYLAGNSCTPFSFRYDGMESIDFIKDWHFSFTAKMTTLEL
ncbi:MAG TPA: hypothetical protein QGH16_00815 [Verrucomicrobiota bacterium]|jgi:hypothetical protein|nr:hypothetical protein [Verrucomicrobiota bacterium]